MSSLNFGEIQKRIFNFGSLASHGHFCLYSHVKSCTVKTLLVDKGLLSETCELLFFSSI